MGKKKGILATVIITIIGTVLFGRAIKVTACKTLFDSNGAKCAFR